MTLTIFLVACGGSATTPDAFVADPDAGPPPGDAGTDAGQAPPCGHGCDDVAWVDAPVIPHRSDHHTTSIHRGATATGLLVVGGIETDDLGNARQFYTTILRSEIAADGTPGAFTEETTPLAFPLAFHGQVKREAHLYLAGGITLRDTSFTANQTLVRIDLDESAHVTAVSDCGASPAAVHPSAEILGNNMYVIGGSTTAPVANVWVASFEASGCTGAWTPAPALPEPRSHHASVVYEGHIYVLGGFGMNEIPRQSVLRSVHDASGALTSWEEVGMLDVAPWTASALAIDGAIWLLGGGEGFGLSAAFVSTVRRLPLDAARHITTVEIVNDPLPLRRSHVHQTPLLDGRIYSVGGRWYENGGMASSDRVFVGTLVPPGQ